LKDNLLHNENLDFLHDVIYGSGGVEAGVNA